MWAIVSLLLEQETRAPSPLREMHGQDELWNLVNGASSPHRTR